MSPFSLLPDALVSCEDACSLKAAAADILDWGVALGGEGKPLPPLGLGKALGPAGGLGGPVGGRGGAAVCGRAGRGGRGA